MSTRRENYDDSAVCRVQVKQHISRIGRSLAILPGLVAAPTPATAQTVAGTVPAGDVWLSVGLASGSVSGRRNNVHGVALGFAGETFINASVIGIGLDTFGTLDPHGGSYIALALALQLGWLRNGH